MKFCQIDGTELTAAEPAFDPYATVVGHKVDIPKEEAAKPPAEEINQPAAEEPAAASAPDAGIHETTGSIPIGVPEEVLELPGADPLKTMYVSPMELKEVLGENEPKAEEPLLEIAPEAAPPPSPFSVPEPSVSTPFAEPESSVPTSSSQFGDPFPAPAEEWSPPPVPEAAWQNQEIGSNTPFQPPPGGVAGESKGLALGSLICGILSCTVCASLGLFLGPIAVIIGFMARKKATENPSEFGGQGLALGGMITGGVGLLFGILTLLYVIFFVLAVGSGALR